MNNDTGCGGSGLWDERVGGGTIQCMFGQWERAIH